MSDWGFPNDATPVGSTPYYVLRFVPAEHRERLAALFALRHKWQQQAQNTSDPGVARLQLGWWREELERLGEGQAKHPALLALMPEAATSGFLDDFRKLLITVDLDLRGLQFQDNEQLDAYCANSGGSFVRLMLSSAGVAVERDWSQRLGRALGFVELLQQLPVELHRGRCPLPQTWLDHAGLNPQQLQQADGDAAVRLVERTLQQADEWLGQAEPADGWPAGSLQRWWRIQRAWLKVVRPQPDEILTHLVQLNPLHRLWLCLGTRKAGRAV